MFWWFNTPYSRLRSVQRENKELRAKLENFSSAYAISEETRCRMERENEVLARQVKELQFMLREEEPDE
jgi:hypothetical protein